MLKLGTTSTVEAREQLREALRAKRPEIRAVAARAVWMSRDAALVPTVAAALQEEQVAFAAREQIRALAAAETTTADQAVFVAWKRFGVGFAADSALVFAQARGPSAIEALPRLRDAAAIDQATHMAFVNVATRRDHAWTFAALTRLASGFPPALVSDVLADTGCRPVSKKDARAGARITASVDGRVRVDRLIAHDASLPCTDAATTLLKAFVIEPSRNGWYVPQQVVLLPLSARYIACASRETGPFAPHDAPRRPSRRRTLFSYFNSPQRVEMELRISSTGCLHDLVMLGYGSSAFLAGKFDEATAGRRPPKMDKTQDTIDKENWGLIKPTLNESFKPLVLGATPVASRLSIVYDFVDYKDGGGD